MNFNSPHHSEDRLTENFENIITKQADVKTPALFPIGLIDPDANTKTQKWLQSEEKKMINYLMISYRFDFCTVPMVNIERNKRLVKISLRTSFQQEFW